MLNKDVTLVPILLVAIWSKNGLNNDQRKKRMRDTRGPQRTGVIGSSNLLAMAHPEETPQVH